MCQNKQQIFAEKKEKNIAHNHLNAQIKVTEKWKVSDVSNYILEIKICNSQKWNGNKRNDSSYPHEVSTIGTFIGDASRNWNKVSTMIKNAKSISLAKKEICKYCVILPIKLNYMCGRT
jgi:hypothetical protein